MGKLACSVRAMTAARTFLRKMGIKINKSTVRGFQKAYIVERFSERLREKEDQTVDELHPKKKDRSLLLGKKLDIAVQEYILKFREYWCPVNTQLVIVAARGIVQAMDQTRLAEASGPATLTVGVKDTDTRQAIHLT